MNYQKIIIAIDNSPIAEKVASEGFELARRLNAEIAVVSVVDAAFLITDGGFSPKEMAGIVKNDLIKMHQMLTDKIFGGYKVWSFIEEGTPYEMILKVAEQWQADLILVGTHGRTGLTHVLTGSVAEKVIRHSVKPVLVIPARELR